MNDTWDDIITEAEDERFVGREAERDLFRKEIQKARPHFLIFYITGQGGAGKTTLLNQYRAIAQNAGFILADTDEIQRDVPTVLGRFAHQLSEQGIHLKRFEERYKTYRQKMDEIENDPQAPQGLAALFGRTAVRASYVLGDMLPGLRKGLEYLPQEQIETQASQWVEYLARKLTNKDEVALVRDPNPLLTKLFFEDLNEQSHKHSFLLCFENFEATRQDLQTWLLRLREYKPSSNIRLAIAGRNPPGAQWDGLRRVTSVIHLDVFTEQEAQAFLDIYGITDIKRREEILAYSNRLPVLMSWLAAPEGEGTETALPTHDIVERFLRWVTDPFLRRVALIGAVPRFFNKDLLNRLLLDEDQQVDAQMAFEWLQTMPFVQQHTSGWRYHEVVRYMLLQYQRQSSPQTYQHLHKLLEIWSDEKRHSLHYSEEEQWGQEPWRTETLTFFYHTLAADPHAHWPEVISMLIVAIRKRRAFALEIIETLDLSDLHQELTQEQKQILQLIKQQLQAIEHGDLEDGLEMFEVLHRLSNLSPQAKGYLLAYRGGCWLGLNQWEKALSSFQEAIFILSEDSWIFDARGETYRAMGKYEEALADFNQAIALDEKDDWAFGSRGEIYRLMGKYEEALADFNQAIALDEKSSEAFGSRGETYRLMGKYEEALADFSQAIVLDEKYAWAITNRGRTYRLMGKYEEALADFNQAVALNEKSSWAIAGRGETYRLMGKYEEALANFSQAIVLNEKYAWAITNRGQTYRLMGKYEEALADFTQAITLNEKSSWAIAGRGETYRLMGKYEEALTDFNQAIALNKKYAWAIGSRGETYQAMGEYKEALTDFTQAIVLNEKYAWAITNRGQTYRLMGKYEEALADFTQAITLNEKSSWAIAGRGETYRLIGKYEEALTDFNQAIALNEKYAWAIGSRGETYQAMSKYEEALADFTQAIVLDEKDDWDFYLRAQLYLLMGLVQNSAQDILAAIKHAQEKLRSSSNLSEQYRLRFNIALFLLFQGENAKAEAEYRELLATCTVIGRLQAAKDDLRDLLIIQPHQELALQLQSLLQNRIEALRSIPVQETTSDSSLA